MNLGPRLDLRQSQQLVMTPQLQQAIKLLALPNLELEAFINAALEANPLLDVDSGSSPASETGSSDEGETSPQPSPGESPVDQLIGAAQGEADQPLDIDAGAIDRDRDTGDADWLGGTAQYQGSGGLEGPAIDERGAPEATLAEHLLAQVGAQSRDPRATQIARYLIGLLDEAGYLATPLQHVAGELRTALADVEQALELVQALDPAGVGARSLSECLALQARDADRYDPCMARFIENIDLLAKGNLRQLKRICDVDDEDFADMLAELRSYDPKPGLRFQGGMAEAAIVPDIFLRASGDGGWDIAINQSTLPRLIINRPYYLELRKNCTDKDSRSWLGEKLTDANWLLRALDQRQKTILKVTAEIVKQQDGFFRRGVSELRPLTLKTVADAIEMHESTVSRVTANKYLHCDRGTFELKYFFTSGVASADGDGAVSAEAVKAQIRALVDAEDPKSILSDDALVDLLRDKGFDLARRTVAKYREAIGIGSSVQRRRQKALEAVR